MEASVGSRTMRITLLGGTRFIGAAVLEELVDHGHDVTVVHRGDTERDDLPEVDHAHLDRSDPDALREVLVETGAQALIDTCAYSRADAAAAVAALPDDVRYVVLSSMDTYRHFHRLREQLPPIDPLPLDESSPTRTGDERYLFRGQSVPTGVGAAAMDDYENLDVEEVALQRGASVLRLPVVYGERDPMRREEFVLAAVRAGEERVEIGAGTLLITKGWVRDVARAIRLAVETGAGEGMALNVGERRTLPMVAWARAILDAAGSDAELVVVPDDQLTPEATLTGARSQHVLVDSSKARRLLGWSDSDPREALKASVQWHLAHPPG
jgi:nucleoside-diphosphate-sugar epimerase